MTMDIYRLYCRVINKMRNKGWGVPDRLFIPAYYYLNVGERLNVKNPKTFTEKMQWLKLYNHNEKYHQLVDKCEVKKYVAEAIGEQYVIKTLAVWDSADDVDITGLPNQFVLKTTNGGGSTGVVICKDKSKFDIDDAKRKLRWSANYDIYQKMGEWVYKGLKPRIIAEELLINEKLNGDIPDFKIWCFDGEPKILFYASNRFNKEKHPPYFDYYDMELKKLPIKSRGHLNSPTVLEHFPQFNEMKDLARKLSKGIPFVRADFYFVNGKVYFGELTFYHDAGLVPFEPEEWNEKLGNLIILPK